MQRGLDHQNDARPARRHHRHVACELNRIPQSFVHMDEDGLAVDRLPAQPHRLAEFRIGRRVGFRPARLTPGPAGLKISGQHLQQRQIPIRRGVIQMAGVDMMIEREGLIETLELAKHEGLVVQDFDGVRQALERPIKPDKRLLFPAERLQTGADIIAGVAVAGIERVGAQIIGQSRFEPFQVEQRACACR